MTLLIFDCDGTLVDSELLHAEVEVEMMNPVFGLSRTKEEQNDLYCGISIVSILKEVEEQTGRTAPAGFVEALLARKEEVFAQKLVSVPGAKEAVQALSALPRCVASNTPYTTLVKTLEIAGLFEMFAPRIYSGADHVKAPKPAPDLFLYAADQCGVASEDCIVIEDSIHGVKAGVAAGMTVFGFTGCCRDREDADRRLRQAGAAVIFDDMRVLPDLVRAQKEGWSA